MRNKWNGKRAGCGASPFFRRGNMKKKTIRGDWDGYAFLIPAFVIYLSVIIFPALYSIVISMSDWNGAGQMTFVGLKNYIELFTADEVFHKALTNNLIWIALTVAVTTTAALLLAVALNKKFFGRTFFRGLYYFPCVIAPIAVSIIWRWMYDPNIGFFNWFFESVGTSFHQNWLSSPWASLFALFLAALWQMIGAPMILFLAGLQAISSDYIEAARIDGANGIQVFFRITVPLLKETFVIVLATLIVDAINVYDIVRGLTNGGPNNATQMLSTYMYTQTFMYNNVGKGTAVACVMLIACLIIVVPYVRFSAREG